MSTPNRPLFVARAGYRRRRIIDAIKLMPVLGALLFLIPVLNMSEGSGTTLSGSLYLFLSWLFLIALSAFLANRVMRLENAAKEEPLDDTEEGTSNG